jgi:hypothetical protein
MKFEVDPDIQAVAEFMQRNIPATRLVGVAAGVHALAPLLWGRFPAESVTLAGLSDCDLRTPQGASGLFPVAGCVDGGSAAATDVHA